LEALYEMRERVNKLTGKGLSLRRALE